MPQFFLQFLTLNGDHEFFDHMAQCLRETMFKTELACLGQFKAASTDKRSQKMKRLSLTLTDIVVSAFKTKL